MSRLYFILSQAYLLRNLKDGLSWEASIQSCASYLHRHTGGAQIHNRYKTVIHNISRLGGMAR